VFVGQIHLLVNCAQISAIPLTGATEGEGQELLLHFVLLRHIRLGEERVNATVSEYLVVEKIDSAETAASPPIRSKSVF